MPNPISKLLNSDNYCGKPCIQAYKQFFNPKFWLRDYPTLCYLTSNIKKIDTNVPNNSSEILPQIFKTDSKNYFDFFASYQFPKNSENALVIVETRSDELIKLILANVSFFVRDWQLYIFHSSANEKFLRDLLAEKIQNIRLIPIDIEINNNQDYNLLMKDKTFWNYLEHHQRVLIFQTDSYIKKGGIESYLAFDYIGSPWFWWFKHFGTQRVGGNGGFSLRNPKKMIEILEEFGNNTEPLCIDYHNEDVFFSYHLFQDPNSILPKWDEAMFFSSEIIDCPRSMAAHQVWRFHGIKKRA